MNNYRYDLIVSLGDHCIPHIALVESGLQKNDEKYPFDETRGIMWDKCGRGGLSGKVDLICNGFRNFLNLEGLEAREIDHYTKKLWVVNKETGMSFRHDFPIGVPIKDAYPQVLDDYKKRIALLYRKINQSSRVLFFYMTPIDNFDDGYLLEQQTKLQARFPKQRIDMLYIMQKTGLAPTEFVEHDLSKHVLRIDMDVRYTSKTDLWSIQLGNAELYHRILRRYEVIKKSDYALYNKVVRIRRETHGLFHSVTQRVDCIEKEKRYFYALSNIGYLRMKMCHFLLKKWVHRGEKRKKYSNEYKKIKCLLREAKIYRKAQINIIP
ncbi:MAG: hypothetical protein J1E42_04475 [Akkermansiaceae bacterium]|nr:hypothetical protein [Akkermansiaceae bacterium]